MGEISKKPAMIFKSLPAKVLALTIVFVLLGEVLIFLPSIANFRIQWMKARIAQAEIAALAAEAAPDAILDETLRSEILKGAGVLAVSLKRGDKRQLMLHNSEMLSAAASFDLRSGMYWSTLGEALLSLFRTQDRVVSVIDIPPNMSGEWIEVSLHEAPLTKAMRTYGLNILWLSIILSLIVASLIYWALNRVLVKPMQRLSANMTQFSLQPEDTTRVIQPSQRSDEIGQAEHQLHAMQTELQGLLKQKSHLAALGLAVSKVSHDLRNMLTTAQVVSDALADVKDPQVQRFAPRLISSLDRAIGFLNQTLKYGQARELPPQRAHFMLRETVEDVFQGFLPKLPVGAALLNNVMRQLPIDADREHIHRVLTNLVRNALQAMESDAPMAAPRVEISAERRGSVTRITVADNGPGIPLAVRNSLFEAFQSAARPGGTGLGLAISRELVEAHGGSIAVAQTGTGGSTFIVDIPDQALVFPQQFKASGAA